MPPSNDTIPSAHRITTASQAALDRATRRAKLYDGAWRGQGCPRDGYYQQQRACVIAEQTIAYRRSIGLDVTPVVL